MRENDTYNRETSPYILISYCYLDQAAVLPLIDYLDDNKGGSFHIRYDLTIRRPMEMNLDKRREIENAHAVLVFDSRGFNSNSYLEYFMDYTKRCGKKVIIAYLDDSRMPALFRLPLDTYHHMRFKSGCVEEFAEELSGLAELGACLAGSTNVGFMVEMADRYRSLIPLQPDFFVSAGSQTSGQGNGGCVKFENYEEFRLGRRSEPVREDAGSIYQQALDMLNGSSYRHRDPLGAVSLLEKSADMGYLPAVRKLVECYENGLGVRKDFAKAETYLRRAALRGDTSSMLSLALYLSEGRQGVRINKQEAFYWFQKAASEGNTRAWYYLGFCYECGSGVRKNIPEALNCYRIGASEKDFRAKQAYEVLSRR